MAAGEPRFARGLENELEIADLSRGLAAAKPVRE